MYIHTCALNYVHVHVHEKSNAHCQKREGANPGQLFRAFGPHQQGAAQSLPGTAGHKYSPWEHLHVHVCERTFTHTRVLQMKVRIV